MVSKRGSGWLLLGIGVFAACGGRSELEGGTLSFAGSGGASALRGGSGGVGGFAPRGGSTGASGSAPNGGSAGRAGGAGTSPSGGAAGIAGTAGIAGDAGAAGAAGSTDWHVDPINGSDKNSGSFDAPFRTLARAAEVARGSETVWLFDGTYSEATEPRFANLGMQDCASNAGVAFAANVQLRALNSGKPRLLVAGQHGLCLSGGSVQGLRFECQQPGGRIVEVTTGVEAIDESSFTNCGRAPFPMPDRDDDEAAIYVSGDARVTLTPGNLSDYSGLPNYGLATVRDMASLTVSGGTVSVLDRGFTLSGSAVLDLVGVNVLAQDPNQRADRAIRAGSLSTPSIGLRGGSTIRGYQVALDLDAVDAIISIDDTTFSDSAVAISARRTSQTTLQGSIANSRFANLQIGLIAFPVAGRLDLSLSNLNFEAVARPIIAYAGGKLSLTDVTITDCTVGALVVPFSSATPLTASFRRVSVSGCQTAGISLAGYASTVFDLGTSASPGGNVLRNNQLGGVGNESNLAFLSSAPILISAIGNTWDANEQGTDENGQCSVSVGQPSLDLTEASGRNFSSGPGNQAILRLAETAP